MLSNNLHAALPDIIIKEHWPLSPLCTLGAGGYAEVFIAPVSIEQMKLVYHAVMSEGCPVYILGGGSNVIFPDGLVHGAVISTVNLNSITWRTPLTADIDSGFKLPMLLNELREKNLGGLEFAAGIPGTLGGAVSGNAGAGGHGVCELIDEVITVEPDGEIITRSNSMMDYSYRHCSLSDEKRIIVSVRMTFRPGQPEDRKIFEDFMMKRANQPHGHKNAGCTFKNPEGISAGKLLDECGCKNLSAGDAVVSERHANFILNRGHASSSDVIKLIELCAQRVYDSTGIKLEPEIKIYCPCSVLNFSAVISGAPS